MSERIVWHKPEPSTTDEHGSETHPAFGAITAHRVHAQPGMVLFDSDIQHTQFVRVTISRMVRSRDIKHDWHHPTKELIEVDMSEAQWASFVSSMNTTAVPCTLRRTENEVNVPGLEYAPRLALSMAEVRKAADDAYSAIQEAMAAVESLDRKAGVKARREALAHLRHVINNAAPNVAWAGTTLSEHAENVVQKARADVEAMVTQKAQQLGVDVGEVRLEIAQ